MLVSWKCVLLFIIDSLKLFFSARTNWKSKVELRFLTVWVSSPILQPWTWGAILGCFDHFKKVKPIKSRLHRCEFHDFLSLEKESILFPQSWNQYCYLYFSRWLVPTCQCNSKLFMEYMLVVQTNSGMKVVAPSLGVWEVWQSFSGSTSGLLWKCTVVLQSPSIKVLIRRYVCVLTE